MEKFLLRILVCPLCKKKLIFEKNRLICIFDRIAFPILDDVPVMLKEKSYVL
ncbi:tetraacyldisaccharide 4'-kinase [Candidatus Legionella polyplacis]|uniref:Trm112 family protein n=1 Tax=Candidatus Legionella polyplacis TaxID=2005262 RepID=A0ABZ2GZQ4_9GAMM|nr:Trm112 family protein [Candidatus Legionella polyplacis]ATW01812.1 tetraacyldisaccharide 4'-kinase [Candidatus Legionella polyplacis]